MKRYSTIRPKTEKNIQDMRNKYTMSRDDRSAGALANSMGMSPGNRTIKAIREAQQYKKPIDEKSLSKDYRKDVVDQHNAAKRMDKRHPIDPKMDATKSFNNRLRLQRATAKYLSREDDPVQKGFSKGRKIQKGSLGKQPPKVKKTKKKK
jgi:hypothetical protein